MDRAIWNAFTKANFESAFALVSQNARERQQTRQNGQELPPPLVNWQRRGSDMSSILMAASYHRNYQAAHALLQYGADPLLADVNGLRAVDFVKQKQQAVQPGKEQQQQQGAALQPEDAELVQLLERAMRKRQEQEKQEREEFVYDVYYLDAKAKTANGDDEAAAANDATGGGTTGGGTVGGDCTGMEVEDPNHADALVSLASLAQGGDEAAVVLPWEVCSLCSLCSLFSF
jgi:hypothetical protein